MCIFRRTLQNIYLDNAKDILIAPDLQSQPFYLRLKKISLHIGYVPCSQSYTYQANRQCIIHSSTQQKTISVLGKRSKFALARNVEKLIIDTWTEKTKKTIQDIPR